MNCLSDERLLGGAKIIYRARGLLPLNIACELAERGFFVDRLEAEWDREEAHV